MSGRIESGDILTGVGGTSILKVLFLLSARPSLFRRQGFCSQIIHDCNRIVSSSPSTLQRPFLEVTQLIVGAGGSSITLHFIRPLADAARPSAANSASGQQFEVSAHAECSRLTRLIVLHFR
jgi:hypothetical protein